MTFFPVLISILAASIAPCSQKLEGRPHYVAPGALRDVTYHDQLTLDAYAPAGEPRPAAIIIHGTSDEESPPAAAEALCNRLPHCTFYPVTGAIHNFENWHPDEWEWKEDLTAWLRGDRRGLWKDIAYNRPAGRELLMDAYIPENIRPLPAVIIIHGGGWEAGDKVTYVSPVFGPLAEAGFAWVSIDYRLTPYVHIPEQDRKSTRLNSSHLVISYA